MESKDYDELENLEILDAARKEYDRLFEEDQQRIEAERILNLVTENTWYEIYEGDVYQFNPDGTGDHSGSSINFEINGGMISITEGAAGTETATLNIVETDDSVKLVPEGNSSYYATESDYAVISEGIHAEYTAELTSYEAWTVRNGSAFSMYFMFSEGGTGWAVMYAGTCGLEWEFVDNNTIKIVVWTSSDSSMSAEYDIFNDNGSYSLVQVNNSNVTATPKV